MKNLFQAFMHFFFDGTLHILPDESIEYLRHGQLHRLYGPAVIKPDGTQMWYRHGQRHRTDGPAIELPDGTKIWYEHGMLIKKIAAPQEEPGSAEAKAYAEHKEKYSLMTDDDHDTSEHAADHSDDHWTNFRDK